MLRQSRPGRLTQRLLALFCSSTSWAKLKVLSQRIFALSATPTKTSAHCSMGFIHQNGDRLREPKGGGGTLADPRPGRGHGDELIDCVGSMSASPHPVDDYLLLSKSVPVIPRYGQQCKCTPSSCGRRGLKNRQKPLRVIFLPSLAFRDRSQIIDLDRGSGHRSCTCTVNPQNIFCCCVRRSTFHEFPFLIFFLLYGSVAQTLKNVGPLDCNLRLLRRRSLRGKISVAEVMHLLTLNVFSANFRVVLFVVAFLFLFFSFIFSLTFFFSMVTSNFFFLSGNSLGVHLDWDVVCSIVDTVVAFKASGHCAMGKRAGVFGAHSVQGYRSWGRPRQGLLGAKKNLTCGVGCFLMPSYSFPAVDGSDWNDSETRDREPAWRAACSCSIWERLFFAVVFVFLCPTIFFFFFKLIRMPFLDFQVYFFHPFLIFY